MGQRLTAVGIKDLDRSVVRSHNVKKKKKKTVSNFENEEYI